jgi:lysozyme
VDKSKLIEELIRDEGEVLHAYKDSLGYLTIGVGHLIDIRKDGSISKAASRFILNEDIDEKIADLDHAIPWWKSLSETRQRVLVNMCFNLGISGLLKFKKFLFALKVGDYGTAKKEMLDSLWARQVSDRADRLAEMIITG